MSKGQTSGEKIEEMLENRRNKRIQRKLPIGPNQHKFRGKQFQQNLLERMERQDNHFRESMQIYKRTCVLYANYDTSIFNDWANNEPMCAS